jgi:DNA-binding beta-propeller fold protein YncE
MTDARRSFWHRTGPTSVLVMLAVAAANPGCSCDDGSGKEDQSSSGAGGTGVGDIQIQAIETETPFDATPSPDGKTIFFTASSPKGPGVFSAPATGGTPTELHAGPPFAAPFGIDISSDGSTLYVADAAAESDSTTDEEDRGQILTLGTSGGAPSTLNGTIGYAPRGVVVVAGGSGSDELVFAGREPDSGAQSVFKMSTSGGTPTNLVDGDSPLLDPSGVAVTKDGASVFVGDTRSGLGGKAAVYLVKGGTAEEFLGSLDVGYPLGLALSHDESTLFVSALSPETQTDLVLVVDIASKEISEYTGDASDPAKDFSQFEESAGLHRAKDVDVFAWADSKAGTNGTVFVLTMK